MSKLDANNMVAILASKLTREECYKLFCFISSDPTSDSFHAATMDMLDILEKKLSVVECRNLRNLIDSEPGDGPLHSAIMAKAVEMFPKKFFQWSFPNE